MPGTSLCRYSAWRVLCRGMQPRRMRNGWRANTIEKALKWREFIDRLGHDELRACLDLTPEFLDLLLCFRAGPVRVEGRSDME